MFMLTNSCQSLSCELLCHQMHLKKSDSFTAYLPYFIDVQHTHSTLNSYLKIKYSTKTKCNYNIKERKNKKKSVMEVTLNQSQCLPN